MLPQDLRYIYVAKRNISVSYCAAVILVVVAFVHLATA